MYETFGAEKVALNDSKVADSFCMVNHWANRQTSALTAMFANTPLRPC
jgi:hypothetical protein